MLSIEKHSDLLGKAQSIKKRFLGMYKAANAGHVGCSLSCAEMMTITRFGWMDDKDEVVLSKGHAAAVLYSTLAEEGILSDADIATFYKNDTYLAAHPPANKIKRIPFATGSLGHGLGLAAGFGLAAKLKKNNKQVFCITSDGEINEGSTWEAALFIAHHQLTNVVWLVDRNRLQGFGRTEDVMKLDPLDKKLEAFGFEVFEADGHDFDSLDSTYRNYRASGAAKPLAIICNTVKGNGWKEFEDQVDCHYLPMKDEHYDAVISEIDLVHNTCLARLAAN